MTEYKETPYLYTVLISDDGPPLYIQQSIGLLTDRCQVVSDYANITHPSPVLILFQSERGPVPPEYFKMHQQIRVFYLTVPADAIADTEGDEATTAEVTAEVAVEAAATTESVPTNTQLSYFTYDEIYDNVQFLPGLNPYYLIETFMSAYFDYSSANKEITRDYAENFVYALDHIGDPVLTIMQIGTSFNGYEQITKMSYIGKGIKIGEKKAAAASAVKKEECTEGAEGTEGTANA